MSSDAALIQKAVAFNPGLPRPIAVLAWTLRELRTQGGNVVRCWKDYDAARSTRVYSLNQAVDNGVDIPDLPGSITTYQQLSLMQLERSKAPPQELRNFLSVLERREYLQFSVRAWRRLIKLALAMLPTVSNWTDSPAAAQIDWWTTKVRVELKSFDWMIDENVSSDCPEQLEIERFCAAIHKVNARICELEALPQVQDATPVMAAEIAPMQLAEVPQALAEAIKSFVTAVRATTAPTSSARRVTGVASAVTLSRESQNLTNVCASANAAVWATCTELVDPSTLGLSFQMSDQQDSGWEEVPLEDLRIKQLKIGEGGADPAILTAIETVTQVIGFPRPLWNARQAAKPGGPHQRFLDGDALPKDVVERLEAVMNLLPGRQRAASDLLVVQSGQKSKHVPKWRSGACIKAAAEDVYSVPPAGLMRRLREYASRSPTPAGVRKRGRNGTYEYDVLLLKDVEYFEEFAEAFDHIIKGFTPERLRKPRTPKATGKPKQKSGRKVRKTT